MSNTQSPYMPARYYATFFDGLKAAGYDVDSLLSEVGLDSNGLYPFQAELSIAQIDSLVKEVISVTGHSDMGFEFGRYIKPSSHDILGYAIISSPTLDYALRIASRFFRLITMTFRLRYTRKSDTVVLDFSPALAMSPESLRFHNEGIAISAHEQFKLLLGGDTPRYNIYGSGPEPAHRERYKLFAPARWHFDARTLPGFTMVLPLDMVDRPLAMADRHALKMAEERCEALLNRVVRRDGLGEWIAMMLREAQDSMPSLEDFAHILHITSRTLDRRLRKEGHQFSQILAQVRYEKATQLLRKGQYSITEVAYQLGYKDVANFTRAFKRQTGMSPSQYMQTHRSR